MNQKNNNLPYNEYTDDDDLDLWALFDVLWLQKWLIIGCTAVASLIAIIYALSLPDIYTSKALLAPANAQQTESVSNALRSYGGLASLAGINLPSSSTSNVTEAIEMLSSFAFFKNGLLPKIFLPDLMAVKSWDARTNTLSYQEDLYDLKNNKWVRKVSFPNKVIPSAQEAFREFSGEKFSKSIDKKTGFVIISTKHQSPYVAKAWLDSMVYAINQTLREDQKKRALISIEYLNKQIAQTSYTEIKQQLSELIQQEIEKLMLIEANEDYIFKVIDPPIVPEIKSEPNRSNICIFGALVGGILGLLIALVRNFLLQNN